LGTHNCLARNLVQLLLEMRSWTCVIRQQILQMTWILRHHQWRRDKPIPKIPSVVGISLLQYRTVNYKLKSWGACNLEDMFHLTTPVKFIRTPSGLATRSVTACKIRVAVQIEEQLGPKEADRNENSVCLVNSLQQEERNGCYWWSDLRKKREMELVTCDIIHLNTTKQQHWQVTECHSWVGSTPHFCSGFKLKSQPRYHLFSRCFMNFLSQARQMSVQYLELGHDHFFHIFNNSLFTVILPCNAISAIDSIQYSVPPVKTVLHKIYLPSK